MEFYDFEVFAFDWLCVIINPIAKTKEVIINDPILIRDYYEQHKDEIWVGYNSRNYDTYILKAILCGFNPKEVNDFIIVDGRRGWEFSNKFRNYPLLDFDIASLFHGLKQLEAFMGNDIRETSVPFDIPRPLTEEEIAETVKYCTHDVEQTIEVFLRRKVEFDAHLALIKMFNLNISSISKSQAQLAAEILNAKRCETDDEWDIRLPQTLKLTKYKEVAKWFLNPENHDAKKSLEIGICGVPHSFAWGGLHGAISKFNYECKDDELLLMADVSQLYPCLMLVYHLLSRGVPDTGYAILKNTIDTSIRLKNEGKKKEREPYKRFNNIIYGAMGDKTNPMYDPRNRNLVCVYGQVLILMLIEKIEPYIIKLIQSNTDGIFFLIKSKDFELIDDLVYEWEKETGLSMTFDVFIKVYQGDVNNYIIIDEKGKCKTKGAYVKGLNDLDNDLPIVNKAINDYLVKGIKIEDTINNCNELIQFQKVVKVSSKYAFAVWNGRKQRDKTFRVFASNLEIDGLIGKCKSVGSTVEKFANTPAKCFIDNGSVLEKTVPDYLDRKWYIDLAKKRIKEKFGLEV